MSLLITPATLKWTGMIHARTHGLFVVFFGLVKASTALMKPCFVVFLSFGCSPLASIRV